MQIGDFIFNVELEEVLEELRRQLEINGIEYLQKEPKRSGDSLQIQCPYHSNGQERRRSAGIRRSDGMFHCFACNEVHTLPEVISFCFGKHEDRVGAFGQKWLVKNFAVIQVEDRKGVELDFSRDNNRHTTNNNTADNSNVSRYVDEKTLEKFRYTHPYMYKRRLTDEIIDIFDIGYDRSSRCITFPVRDISGRTLFIARRSVDTKYFNYPRNVEKPLYGLYELSELAKMHSGKWENEIIVCESMLDALTAWVYGKYAVALNGLGNELQFEQLRKLPCRKLILATDNDVAGKRARKLIREKVPNKIITEYILPEDKKDLNELEFAEFQALEEIF